MSKPQYITSPDVTQPDITSGAADAGRLDNNKKITVRGAETAGKYLIQSIVRRILPGTSCAICARAIIPGRDGVEVRKMRGSASAYFGNLVLCNSVWVCPVCASRITENRRLELQAAIVRNPQFHFLLMTNTVPHHVNERLVVVLARLARVSDAFKSGRAMQAIKEKHGILGDMWTLENTYGPNGHHPHRHNLLVTDWGYDLYQMPEPERIRYIDERTGYLELDMWKHYQHCADRLGFEVSQAAFDVRGSDDGVADYVTKFGRLPTVLRKKGLKWGVEEELTKSMLKSGRGDNRSMWQLPLDAYSGDEQAAVIFREYYAATKGQKFMHYSRGLRALLGMGAEKSLDELVAEDNKQSDLLAFLNPEQWRVVLDNEAVGKLHAVAKAGDAAAVLEYLNGLPGMEYQPVGVEAWLSDVARDLGGVLSVLGGDGR